MDPIQIAVWPKQVHFGVGAVDSLGAIVRRLGGSRVLILCGRTVAGGPMLSMVGVGLGNLPVLVFDRVAGHTPIPLVQEAAVMAREFGADTIVSVGGGSAIDAGKGVCILSTIGGDLEPYRVRRDASDKSERSALPGTLLHVAVPTTAGSASDVLPSAGLRDPVARKKMLFWDDELMPHATVLDPRMAVYTPPELTAATGMTVIARCIEAIYSKDRHPLSTGLALHALRLMRTALPRAIVKPDDLAARADAQIACVMSGIAIVNAMASVVHAVGHVVGGRFGLQHGVSHSILLAPAMRLLLSVAGEDQKLLCAALGGDPTNMNAEAAGQEAAYQMELLLGELPLKKRLRDVGLSQEELASIATQASTEYMMKNVPIPLHANQIEALLHAAW